MKKLVLVFVACLFLLGFRVSEISDTVFERSITFTSLGTNAKNSSLMQVNMHGKAGVFLTLACDGGASDDFDLYIYDYDMDGTNTQGGWHSDSSRDNETILTFLKASSATSWKDDSTIPFFSCDDTTETTSLYIGMYNDDNSATATIVCKFRYRLFGNTDYGMITQ